MAQNTFLNKKPVFDKAYSENWKALYAFAYNILRDKETAEDIIQEVFIDFWSRMDGTEINHFTAYLFQAVRNQCAKKLKKKKLSLIEIDILEQVLAEVDEQPEIEQEKLMEEVQQKAREILPSKCHEIFSLRFYDQMSVKDIALKKNISTSTVENQINKALRLLKDQNIYYLRLLVILIASTQY